MNEVFSHPLALFAAIIVSALVLIKATHYCLSALRTIIQASGFSEYGFASFLLAFATSIPELSVSITASLHGQGLLALGNVVGSNIANISLILGGAALIAGSLKATDEFIREDVFYVFLAGATPFMLLLDNTLSRSDGLFLIAVYIIYNLTIMRSNRHELAKRELDRTSRWHRLWVKISDPHLNYATLKLIISLIVILAASEGVVRASTGLAELISIPTIVMGMIVIGIGTSLPELTFEIIAIRKKEIEMAFGNILGSVVTNSTLILGVAAIMHPITLSASPIAHWFSSLIFIVIFALFWMLVWSKHRLERWEGALLVAVYTLFAGIQIGNSLLMSG